MDLNRDTPATVSQHVYDIIHDITENRDPYKQLKIETNKQAKALLPTLENIVFAAKDPLSSAVHMAVAGNVIDFGINPDLDVERDVLPIASQKFAIDDIDAFRQDARKGARVLYIGDNSGEIVFDRVLIEELLELGTEVTFVVKSEPIINDVTMEDADFTGITGIVNVIETGSGHVGVSWHHTSAEFRSYFQQSDIIISKGHANFETLSDKQGNIYFLLKSKCECVAQELSVSLGDIVFKRQNR